MTLSANAPSEFNATDFEIDRLNEKCEKLRADSVLRLVLGRFRTEIALVSSFGADSAVLLHMISKIDKETPILFLDTEFHFQETLRYRRILARQLGLRKVQTLLPHRQALAELDPRGDLYRYDPDACCSLRKTSVLQAGLVPFRAWISGRKRFQTQQRRQMKVFEIDKETRIKVNPLADWSEQDLERYFQLHNLPQHPLWEEGFRSIGCFPCTKPPADATNARSGRWSGCGKTECGIHL